MNTTSQRSGASTPVVLSTLLVVVLLLVLLVGTFVGYSNKEIRLRNAIAAKQLDNKQEFANMKIEISQAAEIPEAQIDAIAKVVVGNAQARAGGGGGTLLNAIHEAVPNFDTSSFPKLMNILVAKRDGWVMRQKELLDLKREDDNCIDTQPSALVCGGRPKIVVTIITSDESEAAFATGRETTGSLFKK
jgi:hypothetical protein